MRSMSIGHGMRNRITISEAKKHVAVYDLTGSTLRDVQKSCIRMILRRNFRVFCEQEQKH